MGISDPTCRNLADLKKLESFIDIKHSCGYVTLMDFKLDNNNNKNQSEDNNTNSTPKNGDVKKENAQLLEEELDSLNLNDGSQVG